MEDTLSIDRHEVVEMTVHVCVLWLVIAADPLVVHDVLVAMKHIICEEGEED